ncbi:MAG: MBG domain-containing protein, partial [Kiritimatiellae bacterium]|nr:MBG domain-containing protein [Kiritimatiellia bacterium]
PATAQTTNRITLSAESTVGLTGFTYSVLSGQAFITNTTTLGFTASGAVAVRAAQAGNSNYLAAATTQTVTVSKTPVTSLVIESATLTQPYNGSPRTITATSDPAGLAMIYLYNAGTNAPVSVGTYAVRATVDDAIYSGTTTGLMTIVKGHAGLTVLHTNQVYDGTARTVVVVTLPVGLDVDVTYDGSTTAPVNAGTVTVAAAISPSEPSYTGAVTTLLRIAKAPQTIDFPILGKKLQEARVGLSASASSTLPVTFSVTEPGVLSNGTNLSFSSTGVVTVTASQAGNENWNPASTQQDIVVSAAAAYLDFDGDKKADITVYHPRTGFWHILQSTDLTGRSLELGRPNSIPAPGDYDGDAIYDPAVYHAESGAWSILLSATQEQRTQYWGWAEAVPVPGDYDGDGITDVAVCDIADGVWYMLLSSTGKERVQAWGWSECVPVPGDYDGDLITDVAVCWQEGGEWFILQSSTQTARVQTWGWSEAEPNPGDYDGDGRTDVAVYWPEIGQWYAWLSASQSASSDCWGWDDAVPVPADYDGDGKYDRTVYAAVYGMWSIWQSGSNTSRTQVWGFGEAEPVNTP